MDVSHSRAASGHGKWPESGPDPLLNRSLFGKLSGPLLDTCREPDYVSTNKEWEGRGRDNQTEQMKNEGKHLINKTNKICFLHARAHSNVQNNRSVL